VNKTERERMRQLDRALDIAADLFAREDYVAPNGDGGPAAIRRFLLKKAKEELATLEKKKAPGAVTSARSRRV